MATFTSAGLTNGGKTAHYAFSYDTTLQASASNPSGVEPARTNALIAACEADYAQLSGWFGGGVNVNNMSVQVTTGTTGGHWSGDPSGSSIQLNAGGFSYSSQPLYLRFLLAMEVSELFMDGQNAGWYASHDEGSKGEGLSRFLAVQLLSSNAGVGAQIEVNYAVVPIWLNGARGDFVDTAPDDASPDQVTGCSACFIHYLHYQLGYSINAIISAGAGTLAGVYQKLTGKTDAWSTFIALVNLYYPPGTTGGVVWDNIFPVADLSAFWAPNQITTGYTDGTARLLLTRAAPAPLTIQLSTSTPGTLTAATPMTCPQGSISAPVTLTAPAVAGPFAPKFVTVTASYGGKSVSMQAEVVAPAVISLTLSPSNVEAGKSVQGQVSLDRASKSGGVVVDLVSESPGFATVPATVTIAAGSTVSPKFTVQALAQQVTFPPAKCEILGSYGSSYASADLTVTPSVVEGIVASLTVSPSSVSGGVPARGSVTLVSKVGTPTVVALAATSSGFALPGANNATDVASVPSSVTVPAGETAAGFTITTKAPQTGKAETATIIASAVKSEYAMLTVT